MANCTIIVYILSNGNILLLVFKAGIYFTGFIMSSMKAL